jgi:hypothetical protein
VTETEDRGRDYVVTLEDIARRKRTGYPNAGLPNWVTDSDVSALLATEIIRLKQEATLTERCEYVATTNMRCRRTLHGLDVPHWCTP